MRPTRVQLERWQVLRRRGCPCCRAAGISTGMAIEIHHLTDRGRRLGHDFVVPLCHYHHQAKFLPHGYTSYKAAALVFGPSLEREPARFREEFPHVLTESAMSGLLQ